MIDEGDRVAGAGSFEPASWPKVIGILDLSWAGVGLSCLGCGTAATVMPMMMPQAMQTAYPDGMPPVLTAPPVSVFVSILLNGCVSLLLVAAGLVILLRKPMARMLHLVYGVAGFIAAVVGVIANLDYFAQDMEWIRQNPTTAYAQEHAADSGVVFAIMVLAMGLGFAWPVFCLVWFGLVKRDGAEIGRGVERVI